MKTITNLSNLRLCLLIALLSFSGSLLAQDKLTFSATSYSASTLADNCSAGDLKVTNLFLGDASGTKITANCEPGTPQTAYIYAVFKEVTNADRYSLRISYDLLINDEYVGNVDDCLFNKERIPVENDLNVQSINYNCGDRIELRNFYIRWHVASNKTCNNAYSPSKCYFSAPGFTVNAPLVANFEAYNPCNSYNVIFTDKSSGGEVGEFNETTQQEEKLPYAKFVWDFGDGASQTLTNKFDGSTTHTYAAPGTYRVTLEVTDLEGVKDTQSYDVTVYQPLSGLILSKTTVECEGNSSASITASGVKGGVGPYTYSISPTTPGLVQNGNVFSNLTNTTYTVTATDQRNCSIGFSVTITADDKTAPVITAPVTKTVEGCSTSDITVGGQTTLAYSTSVTAITTTQFTNNGGSYVEANVATITYQDSSTGTCPTVVTRTFVITDKCGKTASATQIINIDDTTSPTFTVPADKTIKCDESSATSNTGDVTDEADNCTNTLNATYSDSVENGSCLNSSIITRTWTLSDECGNTTTKTQKITIVDDVAPTFDAPADITIDCSVDYSNLNNTGKISNAADNCSVKVYESHTDVITNGNCEGNFVIERTFSLKDECGNETKKTQTITVKDTTGPTFNVPGTITINCGQDNNDLNITGNISGVADNCSAIASQDYSDVITNGSCAGNYTITRTFTVTDECGNATSKNQTITVQDLEGPEFDLPADVTISCEVDNTNLTNTGNITNVLDACSAIASQDYSDIVTAGSCQGSYTIARTFTVTDACGNTTEKTQTITVQDNTAPTAPTAPATADYQCLSDVPAAGSLNAVDNCEGIISATGVDSIDNSNPCAVVITRTWTFTDSCGNSSEISQTINVKDDTKPVITTTAQNMTFECDGTGNTGAIDTWLNNNGGATATDNCDSSLTWTNDYGTSTTGCEDAILVTFRATDSCGNFAETTATYQIADTQAPTITNNASNVTVECDGNGNISELNAFLSSNGGATASDDCSTIAWSNDFTALSDECGSTGSALVTFTATDGCGNKATTTATFTIEDTTPPTFTAPSSNVTISCEVDSSDLSITGNVTDATDSCSTNVNIEFEDSITAGSCPGNFIIERTFTATDECGNKSTAKQTITVQDIISPTFDAPADITIECDQDSTDLSITGNINNETDNCSTTFSSSYSDEVSAGNCPGESVINRTFTVTDECGNSSTAVQIITVKDTKGPEITTPASSIILECSSEENTGGLQNWLNTNGGAVATDNCSTSITWTNNYGGGATDCSNAIDVTFTATDECGNSSSTTATYSVQDTVPPSIVGDTTIVSVECDGSGNISDLENFLSTNGGASASDECSTITWTNNFNGLSDLCGQTGAAEVTFTATDACGNFATFTRTFKIVDTTPPSINDASSVSIECGPSAMGQMQAWMANNGGATVNDSCSEVEWTVETNGMSSMCAQTGSITAIFTATDACGNKASSTATFQIVDTTAPMFTVPSAVSIECNEDPTDLSITGDVTDERDNCSTDLEATYTDESELGSCPGSVMITRTWTLTDACGNTNTQEQIISVMDTTAPQFTVPPMATLECDEDVNDLSITGDVTDESDNCSTGLEATYTDEIKPGSCTNSYMITRTWTLVDECDNTNTQTQTISVADTTAPTFTAPGPLTVSCEEANDLSATGDVTDEADNCSTALSATFTDEITEGSCANSYTITRTWTLVDDCDNTNTQTQIITVTDTVAPSFTVPGAVTLACGEDATDLSLTGDVTDENDNCSTGLEATYADAIVNGDCPGTYTIVRTWTLVDECGNTTTKEQSISIEDNAAPTLEGNLQTSVSVTCGNIPAVPSLVFVDTCTETIDVQFNESSSEVVNDTYTITREWTVSDECNNTATFTQTITVNNSETTIAGDDFEQCIDDTPIDLFDRLDSSIPAGGAFEITRATGTSGQLDGSMLDPRTFGIGDYEITYKVTADGACPINYVVNLNINKDCEVLPPPPPTECVPEISQAVTPNGDNINDFFTVDVDESCGFTVELTIFNRWGAKIYENNNYKGQWGAEASDASIGNANLVPTGTYYYIINLKNSDYPPFSGPIYVGTK